MDKGTDEGKSPCVLQDFVPLGAAALPLIPIYNNAKQGNGYRWPSIARGRPVLSILFLKVILGHLRVYQVILSHFNSFYMYVSHAT